MGTKNVTLVLIGMVTSYGAGCTSSPTMDPALVEAVGWYTGTAGAASAIRRVPTLIFAG